MANDRFSETKIITLGAGGYCVPGFVGGLDNSTVLDFVITTLLPEDTPPSTIGFFSFSGQSVPTEEIKDGILLGGYIAPQLPFLDGGGIAPDNSANGGPEVIPMEWSSTTQSPDPKFPVADIIYSVGIGFIARILSAPFHENYIKIETSVLPLSGNIPAVCFASSRIEKPLKIEIISGGGWFTFLDGSSAGIFAPLTFGNGVDPIEPFLIVADSDTVIKVTY
tara:strand:- start:664 stop:1329 length:666 start_codon:yes stop_codon:yes gene_type:complete